MATITRTTHREAAALLSEIQLDLSDHVPMAEGLSAALDSIDAEAGLRPGARDQLVERIRTRLRAFEEVASDRRRHPQIAAERIDTPMIITGLPRSGTTILHSIIAQDDAVRAPLAWEVARPSPPPVAASYADDPRIEAWVVEHSQGATARLTNAEFRKKHLIGACIPEECGQIMATTMRSTELWSRARVDSYMQWWLGADHRYDYEVHRRWLQHLQWANPGQWWALKFPPHIFNLPAVHQVYPDARLVQTHRDPVSVISSLCSLIATIRKNAFETVDMAALGREILDLWAIGAARAVAFRRAHPDVVVMDVGYRRLLSDPLDAVGAIYEGFGIELTEDARSRMRHFLASTPQHVLGEHRHSLDDYGLSRAEVHERLADYVDMFADFF